MLRRTWSFVECVVVMVFVLLGFGEKDPPEEPLETRVNKDPWLRDHLLRMTGLNNVLSWP